MSNTESYEGSGVDAPPTPRSTNSEYDYLSPPNRLTKSPPRLQTLNAQTGSCSKPKFNSFLKTLDLERSNLLIKDQNTHNFAQTPSNQLSYIDQYNTTGVTRAMNKILVDQDSSNSLTGPD